MLHLCRKICTACAPLGAPSLIASMATLHLIVCHIQTMQLNVHIYLLLAPVHDKIFQALNHEPAKAISSAIQGALLA